MPSGRLVHIDDLNTSINNDIAQHLHRGTETTRRTVANGLVASVYGPLVRQRTGAEAWFMQRILKRKRIVPVASDGKIHWTAREDEVSLFTQGWKGAQIRAVCGSVHARPWEYLDQPMDAERYEVVTALRAGMPDILDIGTGEVKYYAAPFQEVAAKHAFTEDEQRRIFDGGSSKGWEALPG
jgi:hypothetical protein